MSTASVNKGLLKKRIKKKPKGINCLLTQELRSKDKKFWPLLFDSYTKILNQFKDFKK